MSDINRKIGGHKAAINNPNVSEEAKDNSRQAIDELESSGETETTRQEGEKNEGNVIGGYKATLKNPNVSEEAKNNAKNVLEDKGAL
ncbi:hypothetical protein EIP91_001003 [Steccherinum ochraceum]|uniref:Conidiation-specific protein 6 n=1 Tax=Steccherinum ochraceum TaxID=92696 RepID=A0A4R0REP5_9APHY|nr:hypothetical protein EIP91_001003 [Steccherinum ochraceum]